MNLSKEILGTAVLINLQKETALAVKEIENSADLLFIADIYERMATLARKADADFKEVMDNDAS